MEEVKKPKVAKLIEIAVDEEQKVYVSWPEDKKELCITALAEAIKMIGTYQTKVIVPNKQNNFLQNVGKFLQGVK